MSTKANDPRAGTAIDGIWAAWRPRIFKAFAAGVIICTAGAFIESAVGLVFWALHHGLHGALSLLAPTMVDVVTLSGEIVTAVAVLENWDWRIRWAGILATFGGLAVSVAANIGRDGWRQPPDNMVTFAVAPVAMFVMTGLALMIVKRVLHPAAVPGRTPDVPGLDEGTTRALLMFGSDLLDGRVPAIRPIKESLEVGQGEAQRIQAYLADVRTLAVVLAGKPHLAAEGGGAGAAA